MSAVSEIGGGLGAGIGNIMGSGGKAMAGQNSYRAKPYKFDPNAFHDPTAIARMAAMRQAVIQQQQQAQAAQAAQAGLVSNLQGRIAGTQPSVAQAQLQQTTDANNAAAVAQAASAASVNPALALRNAMQTAGSNTQVAAGQGATLRAGEQEAAEQQLAGLTQGQNQLATQAGLAYTGALGTTAQQQTANAEMLQQLKGQQALGAAGINAGIGNANAANVTSSANSMGGMISGIAGSVGGIMGGIAAAAKEGGEIGTDVVPHYADGGPLPGGPVFMPTPSPDAITDAMVAQILAKASGQGAPAALTADEAQKAANAGSKIGGAFGGSSTTPGLPMAGEPPAGVYAADGGDITSGGPISGPGGPRDDKVPLMGSNGEFMIAADAKDAVEDEFGPGFLKRLNDLGKLSGAIERHHGAKVSMEQLAHAISQSRAA